MNGGCASTLGGLCSGDDGCFLCSWGGLCSGFGFSNGGLCIKGDGASTWGGKVGGIGLG